MGLKKVIRELQRLLPFDVGRNLTRRDRLADILAQLKVKEGKLALKLEKERSPMQRRHLSIELKINRLQQKKGHERLLELRNARE